MQIGPEEPALGYFVREPFPSVATGTDLRAGKVSDNALRVLSQMNEGGVIFADGIEQDFLSFDWGHDVCSQRFRQTAETDPRLTG